MVPSHSRSSAQLPRSGDSLPPSPPTLQMSAQEPPAGLLRAPSPLSLPASGPHSQTSPPPRRTCREPWPPLPGPALGTAMCTRCASACSTPSSAWCAQCPPAPHPCAHTGGTPTPRAQPHCLRQDFTMTVSQISHSPGLPTQLPAALHVSRDRPHLPLVPVPPTCSWEPHHSQAWLPGCPRPAVTSASATLGPPVASRCQDASGAAVRRMGSRARWCVPWARRRLGVALGQGGLPCCSSPLSPVQPAGRRGPWFSLRVALTCFSLLCRCPDSPAGLPTTPSAHAQEAGLL